MIIDDETKIIDLPFSDSTKLKLHAWRHDIETAGQLKNLSDDDILSTPGIGRKTLREIRTLFPAQYMHGSFVGYKPRIYKPVIHENVPAEMVHRNIEIYNRRVAGEKFSELCKAYGLSSSRVRSIFLKYERIERKKNK